MKMKALALCAVLVSGLALSACGGIDTNSQSYIDGYNQGINVADGAAAPPVGQVCNAVQMSQVNPNDNQADWVAGCEAAYRKFVGNI
jgi:hypothetical protein